MTTATSPPVADPLVVGPLVVGVDCGSQSVKVDIFDATGAVVASGREPLSPMSRPRPGMVLHPDDDLWRTICLATRQATAGLGPETTASIVAVGLCPIRCCKAFLDAHGELLEPVMSWMDTRAYEPWLPQHPDLAWVTTGSGYLAHRFTGRFQDSAANNIALQWPINTETWRWSDDDTQIRAFNVNRTQLFELQDPGEIIGPITDEAAAATGLPRTIPVVCTANDKAVEMLGAGPLPAHTALVSLGTYITAMVPGEVNHTNAETFWSNFSCHTGRYLYESNGVRRGMWTLSWFLDLLGPEFAAAAENAGVIREDLLEAEAARTPAGSDGLVTVLDFLAPTDKPFRKGTMLGFDARHTRGHIYRSILEAIALTMKANVDAMITELDTRLDEIVLSGGGSTSALFMQIFASTFGITASRASGPSGASLGAAMCAAAAVGLHADLDAAAQIMSRQRESFVPNADDHALYASLLTNVLADVQATASDQIYSRTYALFG